MKAEYIDGKMLKQAFLGAAQFLEDHKEEVDALNVFPVPDGDTGTNMSLTIKSSAKHIVDLEDNDAGKIALAASNGALMGARGNSGVILSQLFRGFATALKGVEKAGTKEIAEAFVLASETAYKAVMKPTEGTILTVARGCAEYAKKIYKEEKDIIVFLEKIINEGNIVLNKTPEMLPVLKEAGVVDAGGKGLMYVLTGAYNAITDGETISIDSFKDEIIVRKEIKHDVEIEFGYCTEFLIDTAYEPEKFRDEIKDFGDSMMVVGGENLIKVHIHTNNPGEVLEKALSHGPLKDIKIDNMRYQHEHVLADKLESEINEIDTIEDKEEVEMKKYGFVAVSVGDGIDDLFKQLHVDYIIPGGQTMNPSTEDILNAINKVNAENILVLPNNSNIILSADQAKELSEKNVFVFPSKTVPEGITALLSFDQSKDMDENLEEIEEAVSYVKTAQVTYAVRDTEMNGKDIKKDDIIGVTRGDIVSVGKEVEEVSYDLIMNLKDEDSSLITIYYGNGIQLEEAENLANNLEEELGDYDIEVVYGGQPLYYYMFSIE